VTTAQRSQPVTRPAHESRIAALSGERVLVTGGAGFVGSNVVARLLRIGASVTVLDPATTTLPPLSVTEMCGCEPNATLKIAPSASGSR